MPALIAITEDVGAREEKCAKCGEVIGIVDFILQASQVMDGHTGIPNIVIDYVHLDCDPVVKAHVESLRAAKGRVSKSSAEQAQTSTGKRVSRFHARF